MNSRDVLGLKLSLRLWAGDAFKHFLAVIFTLRQFWCCKENLMMLKTLETLRDVLLTPSSTLRWIKTRPGQASVGELEHGITASFCTEMWIQSVSRALKVTVTSARTNMHTQTLRKQNAKKMGMRINNLLLTYDQNIEISALPISFSFFTYDKTLRFARIHQLKFCSSEDQAGPRYGRGPYSN